MHSGDLPRSAAGFSSKERNLDKMKLAVIIRGKSDIVKLSNIGLSSVLFIRNDESEEDNLAATLYLESVSMSLNDFLIILAILLAPVIAVQVQRSIEVFQEKRNRKLRIFKTLMATRAATVSNEHVQALNMIDLEFREKPYKNVINAWKIYRDHLGSYPNTENESVRTNWGLDNVNHLTKLLMEMGHSLGYEFDEVHVKKGIYAPEAHGLLESELRLIRQGLVRLLYGNSDLKMNITSYPASSETSTEQKALREAIQELLDGKRALPIEVSKDEVAKKNS